MGYLFSKPSPAPFIPRDLHGKVAIVTGANSGIGYCTAERLAISGAKVYIATRNVERGQEAIDRMERENPDLKSTPRLFVLHLDLADIHNVKKAAERFLKLETRLDVLINNAGVMGQNYQLSPDGIEIQMATNHLGHFILTMALLPLLKRTAAEIESDVRIVNVSSHAHLSAFPGVSFDSLDSFNAKHVSERFVDVFPVTWKRYGVSKLANILFTNELQRRFDEEGISILAMSLDPGSVKTEGSLAWSARLLPKFIAPYGLAFALPASKGAWTTLFAATAVSVKQQPNVYGGAYLVPFGKVCAKSSQAQDDALAKDLWWTSEKVYLSLTR